MSFQLYLRPVPRTLVLVAATTALVFRRPDKPDARAEIELVPVDSVDLAGMVRVNRGRAVGGVLGLLSIPVVSLEDNVPIRDPISAHSERPPRTPTLTAHPFLHPGTTHEIFLLVASGAIALPPLLSGTSLTPSKLLSVEFHCLSSQLWDDPSLVPASTASSSSTGLAGVFDDFELDREQDIGGAYSSSSSSAAAVAQLGHPCDGMKRYLETGTFYFATNGTWDISRGLSSWNWRTMRDGQGQADPAAVLEGYDERFVWNSNILAPLLHFRSHLSPAWRTHLDDQRMLVPLIQGFTNSIPILQPRAAQPLHLALISRLGWKRAGARFKTRGVDDQGNVANFVETETIVSTAGSCMSFVQVRGSVPLFWEQQGSQAFGHKLQITRPQAASQAAFDKHFLDLVAHYGSVHAINLLRGGESEQVLSDAYNKHLMSLVRTMADAASGDDEDAGKTTIEPEVTLTVYDFHAMVRAGGHDIVKRDFEGRIQPVKEARERFGWTLVDRSRGELVETQKGVFRTNCLDCLDRTNYVEDVISSFTTSTFITQLSTPESPVSLPMVLAAHRGLWADNGDALSRIYAGTGALNTSVTRSGGKRGWGALLSDASKSLGRAYQATFADQEKQISIDLFLGIMAGQKTVQVYDPISDAIQDQLKARLPEYSSSKKVRIFCGTWNLNGKPLSGNFGMWLFPEDSADGPSGTAAMRRITFQGVHTASRRRRIRPPAQRAVGGNGNFCLCTERAVAPHHPGRRGIAQSHSNLSERNADYKTISRELTFQKGRRIKDHELIFWCADLNYRIDLTNEEVREKIEDGDFQPLWEADQLRNVMVYKDAFEGYQEGKINFAPTYKFDTGSDIYDTSEKQRIPAWTGRRLRLLILGVEQLEQTSYDIAHVRTSDHRPVYATFKTEVHIIDHAKEDSIRAVLKKQLLKQEHGTDKGVRPPPPLPVSKKPRNHTPLEDAFLDLQGNGAEEQGGNTNPSGKSDKMGGDRGSKAGAKRE
ncbi:hypothetical protein QFC19_005141 [Naganishia cerealis]|uniref:Uncharacterized protein n=1 Tax=Naganishia cerealis TaxID=610337 RepID=A0ACC2VRH3_9TREE|nr:hypothetical protein QFC19_005141 [Naganishia cerealis]